MVITLEKNHLRFYLLMFSSQHLRTSKPDSTNDLADLRKRKDNKMSKKTISTSKAPQAIGPYSQAIQAGSFIFISGQIPIDPVSGELLSGDINSQTKRVLDNIKGVLEAIGSSLDSVVKTTIYLRNLGDFNSVNEVYGSYFKKEPPARATVEVSRLPKEAGVEIEAVAYLAE